MKKTALLLSFALFVLVFTSLEWKKNQYPTLQKGDVIECLNMETQQAYQLEASTPAFANFCTFSLASFSPYTPHLNCSVPG